MKHPTTTRVALLFIGLVLMASLIPMHNAALAVGPPQITYIRFKRNISNIFVALCINSADGYRRTRLEVRGDGSTAWQLVDTFGQLNGCVEGVLYFTQVIGTEHLIVNLDAWNTGGSTTARFDLFPTGSDELNNCSVQSDANSPLIRDPRYRWDTAAGLACAFIDPAAVGQAPPTPTPAPQEPTPTPNPPSPAQPSDGRFGQQWALNQESDIDTDWLEAWRSGLGSNNVLVAVIDTGVEAGHEDLSGQIRTDIDRDIINNDDVADDTHGHGTHVAGTIAATTNNSIGVAGFCPQCRILPIKVFNNGGATNQHVADGIIYATNQGARVINMSLGSPTCSRVIADAVNTAYAQNVVIVAATGNDNVRQIDYPARFDPVIAVGAIDSSGSRMEVSCNNGICGSNYGSEIDITAPGVNILSTCLGGGYCENTGTSMASPHVAGAAGLLLSLSTELTNDQVRSMLMNSADDLGTPGIDDQFGAGRLNIQQALYASTPDDSTSMQATCPGCAASAMLQDLSEGARIIDTLQRFRDEVLATSSYGRPLIDMFYRYSPELLFILARDTELRQQVIRFLAQTEPLFLDLLSSETPGHNTRLEQVGEDTLLTAAVVTEAQTIVDGLEAQASPELRTALGHIWIELDLERHIDRTPTEVWDAIQQPRFKVFLPNIVLGEVPDEVVHTGSDINHDASTTDFEPGVIVVKFRGLAPGLASDSAAINATSIQLLERQFGVVKVEPFFQSFSQGAHAQSLRSDPYGLARVHLLTLQPNIDVWEAVRAFAADPNVEYAEPNYVWLFEP